MAHSIEIRVPLVDVTLLQSLAAAIGALRPGAGKLALATAPSVPLPAEIVSRAKTGFGVPTATWMNTVAGAAGLSTGNCLSQRISIAPVVADSLRRAGQSSLTNCGQHDSAGPAILALVTDAFGGRGGIAQYNRDFLALSLVEGVVKAITVLPRHAPDQAVLPPKFSKCLRGGASGLYP